MAKYNNLRSERVIDAIEEYIDINAIGPGEALPSERTLMEMWQVSRTTIRDAIGKMCREGRLYAVQGKGNFVSPEKEPLDMQEMISFSKATKAEGRVPGAVVISQGLIEADEELAGLLKIGEGERVHVLTRVRLVNGMRLLIETSHIPTSLCPGLEDFHFDKASLYEILEIHYGLFMKHQEITVRLSKAYEDEAELLGITTGDAVFVEDALAYTGSDERPAEYTKTIVNASRARYTIHLDKRAAGPGSA